MSSKPKAKVSEYYVSAHYGFCHGPVDEVLEVWYGEKRIWSGSATSNTSLYVDKGNLFGGPKKEGGFRGRIELLLGAAGQLVPQALAASLRRNGASDTSDPAKLPGYRGILSMFIHDSPDRAGAHIGTSNAIIKPFWMRVRRAPKGCPFDPVIVVNGMRLANPAAIIYECLTNREWAMGGAPTSIDEESFVAAAETLKEERFGLGILWHKQGSIEDFIGSIVDHIDAALALDPFTGKMRLKLVRDDYDIETLPVIDPSNATLTSFQRRAWGETVNEVNVTWTNPANEQQEVVTVHDTANIRLQGGVIVSDQRNYYGIRDAELALRVATRDLQAASSALSTAEVEVNRSAWRVLPGDVVALRWPLYGFERIPMRVTSADYGKPGDSRIRLTLVEDVFGMPEQSYVEPSGSSWVNPAIDPEPLEYEHITSIPYFMLAREMGEEAAEAVPETSDYDLFFGSHSALGIQGFEAVERQWDATGAVEWLSGESYDVAPRLTLSVALPREVVSVLPSFADAPRGADVAVGDLVWIGPVSGESELALVTAIDADSVTIQRGVLDTVPREWPAETPLYVLSETAAGSTGTERAIGETASVRLLPTTGAGTLPLDEAADVAATMTGRLHRPYRPANLRVDGVLWPDPDEWREYPVTLSWSPRNRVEETGLIARWDDGGVQAEPGTEYRVRLYGLRADGTSIGLAADVTQAETEFHIDGSVLTGAFLGAAWVRAEVAAVRDGLESWQRAELTFRGPLVAPTGLTLEYKAPSAPSDLRAVIL